MSFKENGYKIVRNAISKDLLEYIKINSKIQQDCIEFYRPKTIDNQFPNNDEHIPNSYSWYSTIHTEALSSFLKPMICDITGKNLAQTYTYARTYYSGAELTKHTDRGSCEYSVTFCLDKGTVDWPIYLEDISGNEIEVELYDGDMIVYMGVLLPHWRKIYEGDSNGHRQIFMHYVDLDGEFAKFKYDTRPLLALGSSERRIDTTQVIDL